MCLNNFAAGSAARYSADNVVPLGITRPVEGNGHADGVFGICFHESLFFSHPTNSGVHAQSPFTAQLFTALSCWISSWF